MKLKKHMQLFVRVFCSVVARSETKRFTRDELLQAINKNLPDKRLTIGVQHMPKIIYKQKEFEYNKTRKQYEFTKKTSNNDDNNSGAV